MNFYQFQVLAPILAIIGLFINWNFKILFFLMSISFILLEFFDNFFKRLILFFFVGSLISLLHPLNKEEFYTYKYTYFKADILDYQTRQDKNYILLSNFQLIKKQDLMHETDQFARFPKKALMEVNDLNDFKDAKKLEALGRFYINFPFFLGKSNALPKGVIKQYKILEVKNNILKRLIREKFFKHLKNESARFCSAIFLSDTFSINKEQRKSFQETGVAHILGISILNLNILLIIFYFFIYFLIGFKPDLSYYIPLNIIARILSLLVILIYSYIVGFEYPIIRSFLFSVFGMANLFYKGSEIENLFLSAFIILAIYKEAIDDLGFQLSFLGVLGIYAFLKQNNSKNFLISILYTTFSASSVLIPISIYHFQSVNIQPFLANLLIIPFLSCFVIPSILIFLLLPDIFASYFANFLDYQIFCLTKLVEFLKTFSYNLHIDPIEAKYILAFLALYIIFAIIKEKFRYYILFFAYIIFIIGSYYSFEKRPFLIVSLNKIVLVTNDKIICYPKVGSFEMLSEIYNAPCIDGVNTRYFYKDLSNKIIVNQKIGIIISELKNVKSDLKTNDYIFLPQELMEKPRVIRNI